MFSKLARPPESPSGEHLRKEAKRVAKRHVIVLSAAQRGLAHEYGFRKCCRRAIECSRRR